MKGAIAGVLDYARERMVSLGYIEHEDAFNFENIPRTLLDTAFHLELGTVSNANEAHDNVELSVPFAVRAFKRSFLLTKEGRDSAVVNADTIIDDFITSINKLNDDVVYNIIFDSLNLLQLNDSNDNSIIIQLDFTALVVKCTR